MSGAVPVHGGPDAGPPITMDFSTNAHPMGPNPWLDEYVRRAGRSRYPDPGYCALRGTLGQLHGVEPRRVVIGASASELIWRLTRAWSARRRAAVVTSGRTFGEYLRAARAVGLPVRSAVRASAEARLVWCCNPDNPSGRRVDDEIAAALRRTTGSAGRRAVVVADLAYWPFQPLLGLQATRQLNAPWRDEVVQLWSPNKLHGLTGVRAAYLILPAEAISLRREDLERLAPSWPLGTDGVALLTGHTRREAARFLDDTAPTLRKWKARQDRSLQDAGWTPEPSDMHFGLWRPPVPRTVQSAWHAQLRRAGIKLRDARSFGRPGWVRLVTRAPREVKILIAVTERFQTARTSGKHRANRVTEGG